MPPMPDCIIILFNEMKMFVYAYMYVCGDSFTVHTYFVVCLLSLFIIVETRERK